MEMKRNRWEEEVINAELPDGGCWPILLCGREKGEFRFGQQGDLGNAPWKAQRGTVCIHLHGLGNVPGVAVGQAHSCSFRAGGQHSAARAPGPAQHPGLEMAFS